MKKRMSKIMSILLVSALVISTGNVAQAQDAEDPAVVAVEEAEPEIVVEPEEEPEIVIEPEAEPEIIIEPEDEETVVVEEGKSEEVQEAAEVLEADAEVIAQETEEKVLETMDAMDAAKEITTQATVSGQIPVNKIVTGLETNPDIGKITYYNTSGYKKGSSTQYGYGQAVSLTKGTLYLTVGVVATDSTHSAYFGLYKDAALTQAVDSYGYVSRGSSYGRIFKVPSNGTYYIGVYSDMTSAYAEGSAVVCAAVGAAFYNGADRTITTGKQIAVGVKAAQTTYFKFKATKTGYIKTYGDESASSYGVALYNSKKKALSGYTPLRYNPVYGVTKGKTYYLRVKSNANTQGYYCFKFASASISEKSGTKKTKAVTIAKGKTKKGTIQAGSSQADWYKFKKTSKKSVTIICKGATNGKLRLTVQGGKKTSYQNFTYTDGGAKITLVNYPKGTYYIKISRVNTKSSGYYSLSWK